MEKREEEDKEISSMRDGYFYLYDKFTEDLPKVMDKVIEYNTIEPLIEIFEKLMPLLVVLLIETNTLEIDKRMQLLNCEGCNKRHLCEAYIKESKHGFDEKNRPVDFSDVTQ